MILKLSFNMDKDLTDMEEAEHKRYHRRLLYVFVIMMVILFGGATFYHYVEKWSYIDALYFTSATITTVGYGDITPKTDAGKMFTIAFVFAGVGIVLYGLSLIASHFVEAREQFWLERLGKIKIGHHTQTFWEKIKNFIFYNPGKLVSEYNRSVRKKK